MSIIQKSLLKILGIKVSETGLKCSSIYLSSLYCFLTENDFDTDFHNLVKRQNLVKLIFLWNSSQVLKYGNTVADSKATDDFFSNQTHIT